MDLTSGIFVKENRSWCFEGYEPNQRSLCGIAMEPVRAKSLPPGTAGLVPLVNPFHSEKIQAEYLLEVARPSNLPDDDAGLGGPLQDRSRLAAPPSLISEGPATGTGKGRGCQTAGVMPMVTEPMVPGVQGMKTEGQLPGLEKGAPKVSLEEERDLQRALEVEMVDYLREENSKLADEAR